MATLSFTTIPGWDLITGFGCPSKGLAGICSNEVPHVVTYPISLEATEFTGSYEQILDSIRNFAAGNTVHAAIVLFGNAGGENQFLRDFQQIIQCPVVGGGAAFDVTSGKSGLIPGHGQAAVLLITDDRYTYTTQTKCIHQEILEECILTTADPRTILTINGIDAVAFLAEKRKHYGLADNDFEHVTLSDTKNVNAHLSCSDGLIRSGRDVQAKMLLRYIPHESVYDSMREFYDDPGAIVFGCAGLSGILDKPLDTTSLGLFLYGEVCTVDGIAEFGNLMLSKLIINAK